jgi:hypothetical protein
MLEERDELMITRQAGSAVGIVTLSIGVFVSSAVFALHEPWQQASGSSQRRQGETTNVTGAWTLNRDLSDDPTKVMETMQAGRHGGSGGGHGPGIHGGGGSRGGMDPEQMRARMSLLEPPSRLTITQTDTSVTLTEGDGRSQTLTIDNRKESRALGNRTVEVRTKRDEGRLVKEMSLGDGMKLTETYSLDAQPRQLHVMVKLEGSHLPRPINLRRVYDGESAR